MRATLAAVLGATLVVASAGARAAWADNPPAPAAGDSSGMVAPPPPAKKKAPAKKAPAKKAPAKKAPPPPPEPEKEVEFNPPPDPTPPAPPPTATVTVVAPLGEPGGSSGSLTATADPDGGVHHTLGKEDPPLRRIYFRAGVARIMPLSQSREMELGNVTGPASLALSDGPIAGSGSSVDSATALAAVLGYKLGSSGKWSLETLLGAPFTVKFRATGTLANQSLAPTALGLPTGVQPLGPELGQATAAPPMLTIVRQLGSLGPIRPFAGLGASVLFAYNAKVTNPVLTMVSQPDFSVSPAPGLVLQTGFEANLTHRIYARLDIKFIAGMLANAKVTNIQVATPDIPLFGNVNVGEAKMSVWVNPLVVQAGIGTDF